MSCNVTCFMNNCAPLKMKTELIIAVELFLYDMHIYSLARSLPKSIPNTYSFNIIQNGKFAVVGTYDGRCIFYLTDTLKYHTMIHVRSSRGKNSQGRKVTGIEPMPGEDKVKI